MGFFFLFLFSFPLIIVTVLLLLLLLLLLFICRPPLLLLKPYFGYYDDANVIKVIPCVSLPSLARNRMQRETEKEGASRPPLDASASTGIGNREGEKKDNILHVLRIGRCWLLIIL